MPSVSQTPSGVSRVSALRTRTSTWSPGAASGSRRAVIRMSSASSPYEMTGACFLILKRWPSRSTAHDTAAQVAADANL